MHFCDVATPSLTWKPFSNLSLDAQKTRNRDVRTSMDAFYQGGPDDPQCLGAANRNLYLCTLPPITPSCFTGRTAPICDHVKISLPVRIDQPPTLGLCAPTDVLGQRNTMPVDASQPSRSKNVQ